MPEQNLDAAIAHMVKLKNEHRPILSRIAGDPGMSIDTRRMLIEHLYEEEDEHMAEISALREKGVGGVGGAGGVGADDADDADADPTGTALVGSQLTVGNLRPVGGRPPSLGNLRREMPWPHAQKRGGTVGSLHPY